MFRAKHILIGYFGESLAGLYLSGKGYRFLARNVKVAGGEIDLIYLNKSSLVFVEVKTVSVPDENSLDNVKFEPEKHMTSRKIVNIRRAAAVLANSRYAKQAARGWRLDLVALVIPRNFPLEVSNNFLSKCLVRHYENIG